jgi:hypothetical protein
VKISAHEIWRRITSIYGERSRTALYSGALESEVARQGAEVMRHRAENDQQRAAIASQQNEILRLRAENRALLNSILGIAGIPPIQLEGLPGRPPLVLADEPGRSDAPLPSSVSLPTKCHSESAAADNESRSTPPHPSSMAAEKNSPGSQSPRNDIPPQSSSPQSFHAQTPHSALPSSAPASSSTPRRQLPAPLRRRSWHQIMRTLEFESGKKKAATD